MTDKNKEFQPVNISIITISDSRDKKNDISGNILKEKIKNSGHKLFNYKIIKDQVPDPKKSYMFIANHTSMADIMLMLVSVKNPFVFIGKKELAKIPLFGFFYKRTCILVDRSSAKSRQVVFIRAQKRLKQGLSICIFPEGGVPEEHVILDSFKDGAFRLAINHQIPVVPMTFYDTSKTTSVKFFG